MSYILQNGSSNSCIFGREKFKGSFQATKEDIDDLKLFCEKSKSENTARKYKYAFNGWIKWCSSERPPVQKFPASDFHVTLYLINISKEHNSMAKVNEAFYAISWARDLSGVKNPCHSSVLISVEELTTYPT